MQEAEIFRRLRRVFDDVFDEEGLEITAMTSAADVMGWDSFNHIRLVAAVERTFGIKFHTAEVQKARNVGEFVQVIAAKVS
jgi:acyl carrier protein